MIIIKIIILYLMQITLADDFPSTSRHYERIFCIAGAHSIVNVECSRLESKEVDTLTSLTKNSRHRRLSVSIQQRWIYYCQFICQHVSCIYLVRFNALPIRIVLIRSRLVLTLTYLYWYGQLVGHQPLLVYLGVSV